MQIIYTKSFWELDLTESADPITTFAGRVAADRFDGTEMFLPLIHQPAEHVVDVLDGHGLTHRVIDIITEGATPAEHRTSFDAAVDRALEFRPHLINSHTGRDIFGFDENVELLRHAIDRSVEAGVPIVHETHRYRPTYSAPETRRYLEALPDLRLNADLSHWMVVHESDLSDQDDTVGMALAASRHIHARVGFEEGPQVNDPSAPEWAGHVDRHVELWQRIIDHCSEAGVETLAITPEFGPFPYGPTQPRTMEPLTDVWQANVFMRDLLRDRLVA